MKDKYYYKIFNNLKVWEIHKEYRVMVFYPYGRKQRNEKQTFEQTYFKTTFKQCDLI